MSKFQIRDIVMYKCSGNPINEPSIKFTCIGTVSSIIKLNSYNLAHAIFTVKINNTMCNTGVHECSINSDEALLVWRFEGIEKVELRRAER